MSLCIVAYLLGFATVPVMLVAFWTAIKLFKLDQTEDFF